MTNTNILLSIAYLCYFFVGSLFTTVGVFIPSVGAFYNIDAASLGYIYTFLNVGIFITISLSGYLMRKFDFKKILTVSCLSVIAVILVLNVYHTLYGYSAIMLALGAISGVLLSTGSYLVLSVFKNLDHRASKLIFTDFFFSFAGMILPVIFGWILAKQINWFTLYNLMMVSCMVMLFFIAKADFSFVHYDATHSNEKKTNEKWGIEIYTTAIGAFLFILFELGLMMWLVKYLTTTLHFAIDHASLFVTLYWFSKAAGLLVNQFTVVKMGIRKYLLISITIGMIAIATLAKATIFPVVLISLIILGFINSGIYASLISYGCSQFKTPSPKVMSFIISSGTAGTLVSAWISSEVVQYYGVNEIVKFSAMIYFMCLISIALITLGYKSIRKNVVFQEKSYQE